MMKADQKLSLTKHGQSPDYKLSITLPQELIDAIDREAASQYRTRASLIRQVLAEKFQKKEAA